MKTEKKTEKIRKIIELLKKDLEVLYPLTKSKKIITNSLSKIRIGLSECINLSLNFQMKRKKIKPSNNKEKNLQYFFKISKREFKISDNEVNEIKRFLELAKFQRESEIDFIRKRNSVYLFSKGKIKELKIETLKRGIELLEIIFNKIILEEKIKEASKI